MSNIRSLYLICITYDWDVFANLMLRD